MDIGPEGIEVGVNLDLGGYEGWALEPGVHPSGMSLGLQLKTGFDAACRGGSGSFTSELTQSSALSYLNESFGALKIGTVLKASCVSLKKNYPRCVIAKQFPGTRQSH